jgi:hypothetical protein
LLVALDGFLVVVLSAAEALGEVGTKGAALFVELTPNRPPAKCSSVLGGAPQGECITHGLRRHLNHVLWRTIEQSG